MLVLLALLCLAALLGCSSYSERTGRFVTVFGNATLTTADGTSVTVDNAHAVTEARKTSNGIIMGRVGIKAAERAVDFTEVLR